jgi:hypothetical protein
MCDPVTLILGMVSIASSAAGAMAAAGQKTPEPPAAETPAIAAPTSRNPGATVRLGNSEADIKNTDSTQPNAVTPVAETRVAASSLGNLGKSGLAI